MTANNIAGICHYLFGSHLKKSEAEIPSYFCCVNWVFSSETVHNVLLQLSCWMFLWFNMVQGTEITESIILLSLTFTFYMITV